MLGKSQPSSQLKPLSCMSLSAILLSNQSALLLKYLPNNDFSEKY